MTRYVQQKNIITSLIVKAPYNGAAQRDLGIFAESEGFGLDVDDVRYGEYPVAAGVASREDATLRRPYSETSPEEEAWLESKRGFPVVIVRAYKGDDNLPVGVPRTYQGVLKGVNPPDGDITASERSKLTVMCLLDVDAS